MKSRSHRPILPLSHGRALAQGPQKHQGRLTLRRVLLLVILASIIVLLLSTFFNFGLGMTSIVLPAVSTYAGPWQSFAYGAMEIEWEGLKGGEHCLRYATREYTAKLPIGLTGPEAMKACKDTPVKIHGRLLYTDFCRDLALGRGVWGFWVVDFEEPACVTSWGEFVDLGCGYQAVDTISSFKRVESRLENLQIGADWQIMCVTTPADIVGRHFATPTTCQNSGKLGVYGTWDVNDESCDEGSEDK